MNQVIRADRQMSELGVFVHGVLAGLHILGIAYNLRRRNWFDVVMHTTSAGYDVWALNKHIHDLQRWHGPCND